MIGRVRVGRGVRTDRARVSPGTGVRSVAAVLVGLGTLAVPAGAVSATSGRAAASGPAVTPATRAAVAPQGFEGAPASGPGAAADGITDPAAWSDPLYVVAAPDQGFLGNEDVRDAFARFREAVPRSALWFVTDDRAAETFGAALAEAPAPGEGSGIVVLPLFMTRHHALYARARAALDGRDVRWADPLGESYLAEEILFRRVAAISQSPGGEHLLVIGSGADSDEAAARIREALEPLARRAAARLGLAGAEVLVLREDEGSRESSFAAVPERARALEGRGLDALVIPFGHARHFTMMMSDWTGLGRRLSGTSARYEPRAVLPNEIAETWLRRAATENRALDPAEIGVILVPHGSDFHWNETMRQGIAPLRNDYVTADAFSMVDPPLIERAVRRLEAKGMKAAVLVRIFGLQSSFREKTEYVLGLRREYGGLPDRIVTPLELHTLGGIEDSPHLAAALVDRIAGISEDPSRETVILLAHGAGSDEDDDHWLGLLGNLAAAIDERTGGRYRDIRYDTWREDWPEKRDAAVVRIRALVAGAGEDGTALVIPVRTVGHGPASEYLTGLDYREGTGFAPHPAFTAWLRETIDRGIEEASEPGGNAVAGTTTGAAAEHRHP